MPSPSYVPVIANGRPINAESVTTTGDVAVGDDLVVTGDVTAASVTITTAVGADIGLSVTTAGDDEPTIAVDGGGKVSFGNGTDPTDTALRRAAAGVLITEGAFGVGNSAAATTPGAVVAKIEVFDAAGVSLGFLPVYDAIT